MFRPANLILFIAVLLVIICAALFVVTSVALHSFNLAWDIARGATSPFGLNSWLAVILSVVGYLLVPVLIGLMVTESLTRFVERRLQSAAAVQADITRDLAQSPPAAAPYSGPGHKNDGSCNTRGSP
jgi:hypothetical protein